MSINIGDNDKNTEDNVPEENNGVKNDSDKEDDLITLGGFGQTTYWIFPSNITHCPVGRCKAVFEERSQAIRHYKQSHADMSIVCPKCDRPVVARQRKDFLIHYARRHPGEEPPHSNSDANPSSSMSTTSTGTTSKPKHQTAVRKVKF